MRSERNFIANEQTDDAHLNSVPGSRVPCAGLAAAGITGILIASVAAVPGWGWLLGFLIVTALLPLLQRQPLTRTMAILLLTGTFFGSWFTLRHTESPARKLAEKLASDLPTPASIEGTVISRPRSRPARRLLDPPSSTMIVRVAKLDCDTLSYTGSMRINMQWTGKVPTYGDRIRATGTLSFPASARNPGGFDERKFLAQQGVYLQLQTRETWDNEITGSSGGNPVIAACLAARDWMLSALSRDLEDSPDIIGVITGVVLGARESQSPELQDKFRTTGTLHLFAVSGLHVWMFGLLAWVVISMLVPERRKALTILIPLLIFYALVTGLRPSVVRATIMAVVVLGGLLTERPSNLVNSLAAAAIMILLVEPAQLFATGFQLSFCVVASISLLATPLTTRLGDWWVPDPFIPSRLLSPVQRAWQVAGHKLTAAIGVTLAAWLGSLPLIYLNFYLISPIGIVANLFAVALGFGVLAIGLLSIALSLLHPALGILANNANWLMAGSLLALVQGAALVPGGHFYLGVPRFDSSQATRLTVFDFDAGAAIHIQSGSDHWLIDCGNRMQAKYTLTRYMRARGVNELDAVFLTHGDAGHIGGLSELIDNFKIKTIYQPWANHNSRTRHSLLEELKELEIPVLSLHGGEQVRLNETVQVKALYPRGNSGKYRKADDNCLVLQLISGDYRLLLPADAGFTAYVDMEAIYGTELRNDGVITGWHRSDWQGLDGFINTLVKPGFLIASSNRYVREPDQLQAALQAIADSGCEVFNQQVSGAVEIKILPDGLTTTPYLQPADTKSQNN